MNKSILKNKVSMQISKDVFESKKILCENLKNNIDLILKDYFKMDESVSRIKFLMYQNGGFRIDYSCVFK